MGRSILCTEKLCEYARMVRLIGELPAIKSGKGSAQRSCTCVANQCAISFYFV